MVARSADLELRGPMRLLKTLPFQTFDGERVKEIMFDSSAGTGKSMGFAATAAEWLIENPGTRGVVFSQERSTLARTFQPTFEEHVAWRYGIQVGKGSLLHKSGYTIQCPGGGTSELLLGGLDDPTKWYSFEANFAGFIEANRISLDTYVRIFRALRWPYGMKAHFTYLELNPDSPLHWLHKRFGLYPGAEEVWTPGRVRMRPTHKDNPAYWDEGLERWTQAGESFMGGLKLGTEGTVHYRRLYLGEWCQAEGAIYGHFEPSKHVIRGRLVKVDNRWVIESATHPPRRIVSFFGSMDWGMKAPGTFQVWGVDAVGHTILVAEWYHTGWDDNVWASVAEEAVERWGLVRIVCDSAGKSGISVFNDRLTPIGGRTGGRIAVEADKDVLTGISMVHDRLKDADDGEPWLMFLEDTLQHAPDPSLVYKVPTKCIEEIPSYVWDEPDPDRPFIREKPFKLNDHSVDAMRYAAMWRWAKEFKELEKPPADIKGSMGELLEHRKTMDKSEFDRDFDAEDFEVY